MSDVRPQTLLRPRITGSSGVRLLRATLVPLMIAAIAVRAYNVGRVGRQAAEADEVARSSSQALGVAMVWRLDAARPGPPAVVDRLPLLLTPVTVADATPGLTAVRGALSSYPNGLPAHLLKTVYVVGDLRYGGQRGGGAAYGDAIYVTAERLDDPESLAYTRRTVFHEMATVFLGRAGFDRQRWEEDWRHANAPGSHYLADGGGPLAIGGDAAIPAARMPMSYEPVMFASGFLSPYGQASVRADFDIYSDAIFTAPSDLKRWMATSPRVRVKVGLAQRVYLAADARFGAIFTQLGIPLVGE